MFFISEGVSPSLNYGVKLIKIWGTEEQMIKFYKKLSYITLL